MPVQEETGNQTANFFAKSPYLNVYDFPIELDYHEIAPRPANCVRFENFLRDLPTESFQLSSGFIQPGDKLIYVSMGSYGGIDVDLMKRIVSVLGKTKHRYIVSKGLLGDEYQLPDNCCGENFLPQMAILPIVDLVITHGGNNSFTETFTLGKPMIVMPLFFDQLDNAQRIEEKGYGRRIEPYAFTEAQLIETIDSMLGNVHILEKCQAAANRIANSDTEMTACKRIEEMVERFEDNNCAKK